MVKTSLKETLKDLIPTYLIFVTFLYYFFEKHATDKAPTVFIQYGAVLGLFLVFYFFVNLKKHNPRILDKINIFFLVNYVLIGISIIFIAMIDGELITNSLLGELMAKGIIVSIYYMIFLPLIASFILMYAKDSKKQRNKKSNIVFAIFISILVIVLCTISIFLANKWGERASVEHIQIIVETSVFLAGFGFLGLGQDRNGKRTVFLLNVKSIIFLSLLSIISSFGYIIFQETDFGKVLFKISSGSLFIEICFIGILVLFHDNKSFRSIESKRKS